MNQFVHLRLHTEYSLLDGIVRVPELMTAVAAAGMPAVALTDQSNLFAMVKFYKEALGAGVKPLIGVDAWIREGDRDARSFNTRFAAKHLRIAQNLVSPVHTLKHSTYPTAPPMAAQQVFLVAILIVAL